MQTKFKPTKTRFLFNVAIQNKEFKERLYCIPLRNYILPRKNELFSSWLARVSTINFLQTTTFINMHFKEYKNWFTNRDLDILVDKKIIKSFSKRMSLDESVLLKTSLKTYSGYLNEEIIDKTRNNLISPIKRQGTYNNLYGLKYCPHCLKEENYFKKEWRLSFYNICLKHKSILLDRCPKCKEPLTITKRKYDLREFNCYNCGFKFEDAETQSINPNSIALERLNEAMTILKQGWFEFDNRIYYSISYFKVVKQIAKIIFNQGFRKNDTLAKELEYLNIKLPTKELAKGKYLEEVLSVKESLALFTAVFDIVKNSKSLESFIEENDINIYKLMQDMYERPYFYDEIIWKYRKQPYTPTYCEVKSAVKWMRNQGGMNVSWRALSKLFGVYLSKSKRPELEELIKRKRNHSYDCE